MVLPSKPRSFERGSVDTFDLELPKAAFSWLKISVDNFGANGDWQLDYIELRPVAWPAGPAAIFFPCFKGLKVRLCGVGLPFVHGCALRQN